MTLAIQTSGLVSRVCHPVTGRINSPWWLGGTESQIDLGSDGVGIDFVNRRVWAARGQTRDLLGLNFASTHSTDINAENASGGFDLFAANEFVLNDLGLQVVPASVENLFLISDAPATQTVTVVNTTEYTISVVGSGSIVLSNAGSGTVTAGSSVTLTTTSTSLTCTVFGSLDYAQVETGSFATPPIITAGSAVTRPGNQDIISGLTMNTGVEVGFITDIQQPVPSGGERIFELNDGTVNNRISIMQSGTDFQLEVVVGGVTKADFALGAWAQGWQGFVFSVAPDFVRGTLIGQSAVTDTDTGGTYPTMTKANWGKGYTAGANVLQRPKDKYSRTNFTPDAASHAQMAALITARLAVYVVFFNVFAPAFTPAFT